MSIMFQSIRFFLALFLILVLLPQTPTENALLRIFHESGMFATYGEAKWFLNIFTWFVIFLFLILTLIAFFF